MADRKINWLIYTALVGLIPAILRLLVWLVSREHDAELVNAADFMIFGLVLHISIINEIQHFHDDALRSWKSFQNSVSVAFISFYSCLLACYLLGESNPGLIDNQIIKLLSVTLGMVSFVLSYNVYNKVSKLGEV